MTNTGKCLLWLSAMTTASLALTGCDGSPASDTASDTGLHTAAGAAAPTSRATTGPRPSHSARPAKPRQARDTPASVTPSRADPVTTAPPPRSALVISDGSDVVRVGGRTVRFSTTVTDATVSPNGAHLAFVDRLGVAGQPEALGMAIEEGRHMLAVVGIGRLRSRRSQGGGAHHLDIQPLGKGAWLCDVRGVVGAGVAEAGDRGVDHGRIGQWAVRGQAHEGLGGTEGVQRPDEAPQHVGQVAPMDGNVRRRQRVGQDVVPRLDRGRHHDAVQGSRPPQALDLAEDHRRAGHRRQHLAGQAGRGHPGLQDGEDHFAPATFSARAWATWAITGSQSLKSVGENTRVCGYQG